VITRHFPDLFSRQALRALARHPVLLLLNIASIALGVAVFLAIQIANRSANESFRAGIELVAGRANLEVRGTIDETVLPRIAKLDGVRAATPLVEGVVSLPATPGEYLRIVGVDPFSGGELRTFELLGADRARIDLETWLREPDAIAIPREYAERVLPKVGNPIRIRTDAGERTLKPAFILEPAVTSGDPRVAAMDIGWAQELLGRQGRLTAILLLVEPGKFDAVREAIRVMVPSDIEVGPPGRRSAQIESMLGAFQLNLTALSLVSVLVGAFLIYNTISASVVRRRTEIGILRALGASRAEVRLLFLGEAAFAGFIGTILGATLALPLASALIAPLTETIRTLYILTSVERLFLSPLQFAEAFAVGLGTALLAAWMPANEASRANPALALHPGSTLELSPRSSHVLLPVGATLLVASAIVGWMTLQFHLPLLGFVSTLCILAGFSLLVPATIRTCARLLQHSPRYLRMASGNLARSMHRNAVTVAALAAAIAMTVSVSVMIHSFRASVDEWIDSTLVDDLFIGPANDEVRGKLPAAGIAWLKTQPGVENISTRADTTLSWRGDLIEIAILDGTRPESLHLLDGEFDDFLDNDAVIVSEPFANRFNIRRGNTLELPTPRGIVAFRVSAVFQDYARSAGLVMIQRRNYERHWEAFPAQAAALKLGPAANSDALVENFRAQFGSQGQFRIYSNASLRKRVFEIFDQTFAITLVLRVISILVAGAGVTLSLLILTAEREREIGVLRAIGASRAQVVGLFLREAGLIGLIASLVGIASGACLSMVLTWVINKAFFGWTISLNYPIDTLLATPLWIVPIAIIAALFPAWRAACVPPARAVRFE
jgi:putative ABC transport system permease protein